MLKQYGPTVSDDILKKLVSSFAELRQMSDAGAISYPYSTREVVNVVKHLEVKPTILNLSKFYNSLCYRNFLVKVLQVWLEMFLISTHIIMNYLKS